MELNLKCVTSLANNRVPHAACGWGRYQYTRLSNCSRFSADAFACLHAGLRTTGVRAVGTIIGPVIGGLLVQPAELYPSRFSSTGFFARYVGRVWQTRCKIPKSQGAKLTCPPCRDAFHCRNASETQKRDSLPLDGYLFFPPLWCSCD